MKEPYLHSIFPAFLYLDTIFFFYTKIMRFIDM